MLFLLSLPTVLHKTTTSWSHEIWLFTKVFWRCEPHWVLVWFGRFIVFQYLHFGLGTHAIVAHSKRVLLLFFIFIFIFIFFWFSRGIMRLLFMNNSCKCWLFHGEECIRALFMDPQIPLFSNFFIKNGSHDTIYTFKKYFVIVFSVSVFSFSKNKLNPNKP